MSRRHGVHAMGGHCAIHGGPLAPSLMLTKAPELFQKRKYDETVDVFAFGTMLWEVVAVEMPHANLEPADIAHRGLTKEAAGLSLSATWPRTLKTLLKLALSAQAEQRPKMTQVLRDMEPIIRDAVSNVFIYY